VAFCCVPLCGDVGVEELEGELEVEAVPDWLFAGGHAVCVLLLDPP